MPPSTSDRTDAPAWSELQHARTHADYSHSELAHLASTIHPRRGIDLDAEAVAAYEAGTTVPTWPHLDALAAALGVPVRDLAPLALLGHLIHTARVRARLSARQAADTAACSTTTWLNLERGTRTQAGPGVRSVPTPAVVIAAARTVGVDLATALTLAGHNPQVYATTTPDTGDVEPVDGGDLVARINQLGPAQKAALGGVVDVLLTPRGGTESGAA
jgi:hypothetical protein